MVEQQNVIPLRAPVIEPVTEDEAGTLANLMRFCEQMNESLQHVTAALVSLETRLRRMELAAAKAEKQKLQSTAIFNAQGERVR